jgi:hypoxanthine phosphoribosyltransferase
MILNLFLITMHPAISKILILEETIQKRVQELGLQITKDYQDKESLICIGILNGAFMFTSDLVKHINLPTTTCMTLDFLSASSYGDTTTTSGTVKLLLDLRKDIKGKHVLIIEDIVDTGLTLTYLIKLLKQRKPASLKVCTLLVKEHQEVKVHVDYFGFNISKDAFVIGYGLDFAEQFRNLPYIGILDEKFYKK